MMFQETSSSLRLESPGPALPGPGHQLPECAEARQVSQVETAAMPSSPWGKGPSPVGHAISPRSGSWSLPPPPSPQQLEVYSVSGFGVVVRDKLVQGHWATHWELTATLQGSEGGSSAPLPLLLKIRGRFLGKGGRPKPRASWVHTAAVSESSQFPMITQTPALYRSPVAGPCAQPRHES